MKAQAQSLLQESKESVAETVKKEILAEQKGRTLHRTNKRDLLILEFTDDGRPGGAVVRNQISTYLFEHLKGFHVPTHFLGARAGAEMLVKLADPVPMLVRVFNVPPSDWNRRFGMDKTERLEFPVIEHYLVSNGSAPSWVNEYHLYGFNLLSPEEFRQMNRIASKVNAVLRGLCERRDLWLADAGLTFGRYNSQIVLTGELSPANCRFLDRAATGRKGGSFPAEVDTASEGALERFYSRLRLNG